MPRLFPCRGKTACAPSRELTVTDERLREHERAARGGDPAAARALEHERARAGVPVCAVDHSPRSLRVCVHLLAPRDDDESFLRRFTGQGVEQHLLCAACAEDAPRAPLADACLACFRSVEARGLCAGHLGEPQVLERSSSLRVVGARVDLGLGDVVDLAPVTAAATWLVLTADARLHVVDLDPARVLGSTAPIAHGLEGDLTLHAWAQGDLAALVEARGRRGLVVDAATGAPLLRLDRGDYHPGQSEFPLAFLERDGRTFVVHGADWNRLDVTDPRTGARPFDLAPPGASPEHSRPGHPGDHFRGRLRLSPGGGWLLEDGWQWQPVGWTVSWSVDAWLGAGTTDRLLRMPYDWGRPMCWVDERTVALWGYGEEAQTIDAAVLVDVTTGELVRWFAGPSGGRFFCHDGLLVDSRIRGLAVWDLATGERLLDDPDGAVTHHHPGRGQFAWLEGGALDLVRLVE